MVRLWWKIRGPRLTVGVRAIVVDPSGRICLVRHSYRNGWFLPGGGVKTGESLVDAMTRELAEETGIVPATNSHPVHGVYSSFLEHKSDHVVVFLIRDWQDGADRRGGAGEIAEMRFVDPNELPADTSPATQRPDQGVRDRRPGRPPLVAVRPLLLGALRSGRTSSMLRPTSGGSAHPLVRRAARAPLGYASLSSKAWARCSTRASRT